MVKDIDQLIALCDSELSSRQYRNKYQQNLIRAYWTQLRTWLEEKKISEFDEVIANHFCDEKFGCHLLPKRPTPTLRLQIRSIRNHKRKAIEAASKEIVPQQEAKWDNNLDLREWLKSFNRR